MKAFVAVFVSLVVIVVPVKATLAGRNTAQLNVDVHVLPKARIATVNSASLDAKGLITISATKGLSYRVYIDPLAQHRISSGTRLVTVEW